MFDFLNLYGVPAIVPEVYWYGVEEHARMAVARIVQQRATADFQKRVTKPLEIYVRFRPTEEGRDCR